MKKTEIINYIQEKSFYSVVADNYTNMGIDDVATLVKELDYALSLLVSEEKYKEIIASAVKELEELWEDEIEEENKENISVPMLKIGVSTGTMKLNVFYVEGTKNDDLASIIDEYVQEHKSDFAIWTIEELSKIYDNDEDIISESSTAINGGEYFIGKIELVEEATSFAIKEAMFK